MLWKALYSKIYSHEVYSYDSEWKKLNIAFGNALVPNRRQAITLTNHERHMISVDYDNTVPSALQRITNTCHSNDGKTKLPDVCCDQECP